MLTAGYIFAHEKGKVVERSVPGRSRLQRLAAPEPLAVPAALAASTSELHSLFGKAAPTWKTINSDAHVASSAGVGGNTELARPQLCVLLTDGRKRKLARRSRGTAHRETALNSIKHYDTGVPLRQSHHG